MSDCPDPHWSTEPIRVRRIASGRYITLDGRFEFIKESYGSCWTARVEDWAIEPVAGLWFSEGRLRFYTLRFLRCCVSEVYARQPRPLEGQPGNSLADALGL